MTERLITKQLRLFWPNPERGSEYAVSVYEQKDAPKIIPWTLHNSDFVALHMLCNLQLDIFCHKPGGHSTEEAAPIQSVFLYA